MGRTTLPPAERKLRGNAGKRKPKGKAAAEPKAEAAPRRDAPAPPAWLKDEVARAEWERQAPELMRMRVLAPMDHTALALYCQAFASYVAAQVVIAAKGATYTTTSKHGEMERLRPEVKIAEQAEKTMLRYGQQFGLLPLSRTKVASGFLQNGQQLPLPGFDGAALPQKPSVSDGKLAQAKDEAAEFFGYH